jgi:hypothetical protein
VVVLVVVLIEILFTVRSAWGIPPSVPRTFCELLVGRLVAEHDDAMPQVGYRRLNVVDTVNHQGPGCAALKRGFRKSVDVGVIPVEARRLVGGELQAVAECVAGIDQGLDYVISMARRRSVGAVVVDIHGAAGDIKALSVRGWTLLLKLGIAAGGRVKSLSLRSRDRKVGRRVVGHRDVQGVAGSHVQGWILQATRGHEAVQLSALQIGCGLIGELYIQNSILAEKGGRLMDNAAWG